MSNFSGFLSPFTSTYGGPSPPYDILSTASLSQELLVVYYNSTTSLTGYYGRYFYVGDLLIQFSDFSVSTIPEQANINEEILITFPITYSSNPYSVVVYAYNPTTGTTAAGNSPVTLNGINTVNFSIAISNNNSAFGFFAIGPR
jgi:hypothetical protein